MGKTKDRIIAKLRELRTKTDEETQRRLIGRQIVSVDSAAVAVNTTGKVENIIVSIQLDDGSAIELDAIDTAVAPVVIFEVVGPQPEPRRLCRACHHAIGDHAPHDATLCGACLHFLRPKL